MRRRCLIGRGDRHRRGGFFDDYGGSLSELAREQLPAAEQAALAQLAAWGIVPQPANESRCLNYDCLSMENYEGVRLRQYRMTQEEQG